MGGESEEMGRRGEGEGEEGRRGKEKSSERENWEIESCRKIQVDE